MLYIHKANRERDWEQSLDELALVTSNNVQRWLICVWLDMAGFEKSRRSASSSSSKG